MEATPVPPASSSAVNLNDVSEATKTLPLGSVYFGGPVVSTVFGGVESDGCSRVRRAVTFPNTLVVTTSKVQSPTAAVNGASILKDTLCHSPGPKVKMRLLCFILRLEGNNMLVG